MYSAHLLLAHNFWKSLLKPGDTVVDATCGNGQDAQVLGSIVLTENCGRLFCFDIQEAAVHATKKRLYEAFPSFQNQIFVKQECHTKWSTTLEKENIKGFIYNLGWLPNSDKAIVTQVESTLESIQQALKMLSNQGIISIMCYPGHPEGKNERDALLKMLATISKSTFLVSHHQWINRSTHPELILIRKS
jgi:Putative rRNA methylase.